MQYEVSYTKKALDDLLNLPKKIAKRILDKIAWYRDRNPLNGAKRLTNRDFGTYRWRVGDYRILFDIDTKGEIHILMILTIKHRRHVYEKQ